jgi:hypothetical protein
MGVWGAFSHIAWLIGWRWFGHGEPMIRVAYISAATRTWYRQDIQQLVASCNRRNRFLHITGRLVFHRGEFFQIMEGRQSHVLRLFDELCEDPRHFRVILVSRVPVRRRRFSGFDLKLEGIQERGLNRLLLDALKDAMGAKASEDALKALVSAVRTYPLLPGPRLQSMQERIRQLHPGVSFPTQKRDQWQAAWAVGQPQPSSDAQLGQRP